MAKHYDKQFKLDAVQYYHDHKKLRTARLCYKLRNQSADIITLAEELRETGDIESRRYGNYASDEAKEIARLKRELRDAQDALEVLKKAIDILGGEAIYTGNPEMAETAHKAKRQVSVSGMLKHLGVYRCWLSCMAKTCSF